MCAENEQKKWEELLNRISFTRRNKPNFENYCPNIQYFTCLLTSFVLPEN